MMRTKLISTVVAMAIGGVGVSLVTQSQSNSYPSWIPLELHDKGSYTQFSKGYQWGSVKTRTAARFVEITWSADAHPMSLAASPPQWDYLLTDGYASAFPTQSEVQEIATRYYPIGVGVTSSTTLLVSGILPGGASCIEKWTFTYPSAMPAPYSDGDSTRVDVGPPRLTSVDLLELPVEMGVTIAHIAPLRRSSREPAENALVITTEGDVYSLALDGSGSIFVCGPQQSGTIPAISELATPRMGLVFSDHDGPALSAYVYRLKSAGYLYKLWPALTLFDSDRDGAIDGSLVITESQWSLDGWEDLGNYPEWWRSYYAD